MDDDKLAAALAKIRRAGAAHRRAERHADKTREALHAAIVEAFQLGARPVQVDAASIYDRNHNLRIRQAAETATKVCQS